MVAGVAWLPLLLAPPRSQQQLSCELWAPGGSLCSPEISLVQESLLCTTLEHSAADCAGTRASHFGDLLCL